MDRTGRRHARLGRYGKALADETRRSNSIRSTPSPTTALVSFTAARPGREGHRRLTTTRSASVQSLRGPLQPRIVLRQKGEFRKALEAATRPRTRGGPRTALASPSARWVRECERLVELDGKLSGILEGKTTPASPDERIELAVLCSLKRLHRAAVRFYEEAFAAKPALAINPDAFHRYNAACAAALAGCGQGKDADKLDGMERGRLRRQALDWLRADLDDWRRLLDEKPDKIRTAIVELMRHSLDDLDFAGVRGPQALAKLPEAEREPWQKLWDDVANTLARAQANTTPEKKSAAK